MKNFHISKSVIITRTFEGQDFEAETEEEAMEMAENFDGWSRDAFESEDVDVDYVLEYDEDDEDDEDEDEDEDEEETPSETLRELSRE